MNEEIIGL